MQGFVERDKISKIGGLSVLKNLKGEYNNFVLYAFTNWQPVKSFKEVNGM